jgi:methyl-accepting chemotaxis protein
MYSMMIKKIGFKSIKSRIMAVFSGVIALMCIGLALAATYNAAAGLKANVDSSIQEVAERAAGIVNERLNNYYSELNALASTKLFHDIKANRAEIMELLTKVTETRGHLSLLVADSTGAAYRMDGSLLNIGDRDYFQKSMQGQNAVSDPIISKSTGKLVIIFSAPIKNDQNQVTGVLALTRDGDGLSELIVDVAYGKSGKAFMLDKEGFTIAHSNRELVLNRDNDFENVKKDPGLQPLVDLEEKMVAGAKGVGEYRYNGISKYMGFCPVPGTDWSLAVAAPSSEVFVSVNRMWALIMALSLIFIVIGGAISYLVAIRISMPIKLAINQLEEVALGNLEIEVPEIFLERRDEIGKLAHTIQGLVADQREKATAVNRFAQGDLNAELNIKSEKDILNRGFNQMAEILRQVIEDINLLAGSAIEGDLAVRADAGKYSGDYAKIITGINNTLDAIILPLNDADQVLQRMALNDYTISMQADRYQGVLRQFAEGINMVRARLLSVQDVAVKVSHGDTGSLEEFRKNGRRSENDQMIPAFIAMMAAIEALIAEVERLTQAAVDGDLQARGNVERFEGGYQKVISGFNNALDAMVQPVNEASAVLQEMAGGNLNVAMDGTYRGGHAVLAQAVNRTLESFNDVLSEFYNASSQVASGAQQVSSSSQVLAQAASEQASTVEEITASMDEIAGQTRHNAESATQANGLALAAKDQAASGNEQMKKMLEAMNAINESSANIAKIIKVIDEIAFQTNILALNAAVEAARAGQHGKGFAVVAEEVRNLAGRSANAAKETTALIESSIRKVDAGTQIANQTAASLDRIVAGIVETTTLVGDIANSSNEQASGIAQVNQGVNQIAQVTQTNTATAEESAASSQELAGQAEMLKEMVVRFQLRKQVQRISGESSPHERRELAELNNSAKIKIREKAVRLDAAGFDKY